MAGSYKHVTNSDGTYRGIDLIDNLGDADEALEECVWLIRHLAERLAGWGPGLAPVATKGLIEEALEAGRAANWGDGKGRLVQDDLGE